MTPPTDREIDIQVAKLCGCRVVKQRGRERYDLIIPGGVRQIDFVLPDGPWSACPKYSTDLNAIDAAVRVWATTPERRRAWNDALDAITGDSSWVGQFDWYFGRLNATARQRCEALLASAKSEGKANV